MATTTIPASEAQIKFLSTLATQRDLTKVTEYVPSDFTGLTKKQASDLITVLKAAPFKPRPKGVAGLPASTFGDRMDAHLRAKRDLDTIERAIESLGKVRVIEKVWRANQCASCTHAHEGGACTSYVTNQIFFDDWGTYPCGCTEFVAVTDEQWAAIALDREQKQAVVRVWDTEPGLRKGDRVEVVKGRKYPKGLRGVVLWIGDGMYGQQALVYLLDVAPGKYADKKGEPKIYIATGNLAHTEDQS